MKGCRILVVGAIKCLPEGGELQICSETCPDDFVIVTAEQANGLVAGDTIMYYPFVPGIEGPFIRRCLSTYLFPGIRYAF